ncbi:phage tail assembly protein [Escherichia fergusonii]|uniref:phage tail assembly protein n=1 Tax=Escherichia fergusonii TaxID=564 RepID=UPI0020CBC54A|nr:phage tail assembly protein [Escherichia fergusonii]MCP9660864.1 phage tail assembly protein [Escherichia fergusonii]
MDSLLESMTIILSRPLNVNGTDYDTITIREPKVRDRILFSKDRGDPEEKTARMLARLANFDEKDLYGLPSCDYAKLEEAFNELVKPPADRKQIS